MPMKKIGLALVGVLAILALLSGVALADCSNDCFGSYKTCSKLCEQTTERDSPAELTCITNCIRGLSDCIKRCRGKDKIDEDASSTEGSLRVTNDLVASDINCVCASCNKPCGTGHETWCQYAPKANTPMTEGTTKTEGVIAKAKSYNCLCTQCNHNWVSTSKPTKCPNCGNIGITYTESTSENTVNKEELVAVNTNIILGANCIEKGLQCTLNGTPCCAPYECKGKFPNTYCQ
jgi:hypothetical protein